MTENQNETDELFNEKTEMTFKKILRVMSWIVGICFVLIIILPNFRSDFLDKLVKIIFFLGIINLILFAVFESFAKPIKRLIEKSSA